ncbi:MAG: peptidoglycan bridge formation glycyltransferase FemA/FemB family protein [Microgenomates group bacterium]|nr:peptidoglycan bridge formation glycyltransferase FemA/FemB family protein [Microgenomates group bacterium]
MNVQMVENKNDWEKFFNDYGSASFLQSWQWGEFQKTLGYDISRLGFWEKGELRMIAQVIKIKSKRGNFLFIPHGPVINCRQFSCQKSYLKTLRDFLVNLAKKDNFSFIRISPLALDDHQNQKLYRDLGFKTAPVYMHAETMWILNLNPSEETLMANMRKTTRYLIKRAGRENVVIEKRTDEKAVDDFYRLYEETARREKFVPFSKKYISNEFKAFNQTGDAVFLFGYQKKTTLASALIIFTRSTAFYHQGASIHSKIPVTYLLQWEAIKEAKKRGCQFYNFWGIMKKGRTPKSWSGLTLFKQGFGGQQVDYLPTQDYPVKKLSYTMTVFLEKILNWKRGV